MQARPSVPSIQAIGLLLIFSAAGFAQSPPTLTANPNPLNLDNTTGPQSTTPVTLTTSSTTPITFTVAPGNSSWLTVTPLQGTVSATSPATLSIQVNSSTLSPGQYNVIVPVSATGTAGAQISVNLNVEMITGLTTSPPSVSWIYQPGGTPPSPQVVTLSTLAGTFNAAVSANSPWLLLGVPNPPANYVPQSQLNGSPTSGGFTVVFNSLAALNSGTIYTGTVLITDANGNQASVTVSLTVLGPGSGFAVSPNSVTLTTSGPTETTTLNSSAPNPTTWTATASVATPQGGTWLNVTPSGTTPANLTVTANPTGLPAGTYTGTITVVAGILSATVQVTFVVNTGAGGGGNVVSSQSAFTVNYQSGGTLPQTQTAVVLDASGGSASIPFTVSAVVPAGSPTWLSVAVQGGGTQGFTLTNSATVLINVNPASLPAGSYTGTVNISPSGGTVVPITVTLVVQGSATVTASPQQLNFSYQIGGTVPAPQQVQVSGNASNLSYTVVATTTSGANWLSAGTTGGVTPATLNVTVTPGSLAVGTYQGNLAIAGTGTANGTTNIAVTLTVIAASVAPTINSVQNAASFASGAVAPGEIVSIFGTNLGPATPVGTAVTPGGTVSTSIGNVQVLFNGTAAPLTYVSATQINCVVPYEFANVTSPYVQVKYLGQGSNDFPLQQASTAPGIFAASSGKGQGAILNSDNTYNGTGTGAKPAPAGSTIQVYMTGEGLLVPAVATGSITCAMGCATLAQIPKPALPVAVLINGQPATVAFYGEASGDVSGVLQVDVTIPPGTPSGAVPIVISIGAVQSQSGVTVAVQ